MYHYNLTYLAFPFLFLWIEKTTCFFLKDKKNSKSSSLIFLSASSTWSDLEKEILNIDKDQVNRQPLLSIDSALDSSDPIFSTERPTLFRERHGWCPYSERVWLALELANVPYDTIRIDNTGHGPRPSYFGGQTPQMKWPESSRNQGESMDLVAEVDRRYNENGFLSSDPDIQDIIRKFSTIFPRARPSSRAAYLFQYNGEPLWKSVFEETLQTIDTNLLSGGDTPYFGGQKKITAADICYAPFLERWRYQLPCLHRGLDPSDASQYPNLAQWYNAMDQLPAYACRVKGDAGSWRKVLVMSGFGNAGLPPSIADTMEDRLVQEESEAIACINQNVWNNFRSTVCYPVPKSPYLDAATIMVRNQKAIVKDAAKRMDGEYTEKDIDLALQVLIRQLIHWHTTRDSNNDDGELLVDVDDKDTAATLAAFLDDRMCVPRDMGAMSAASLKKLSIQYRESQAGLKVTTT